MVCEEGLPQTPPAAVRRGRPETRSPKQPAVVVPALPWLWLLGSPGVPGLLSVCLPPASRQLHRARPCFSFPRTCSLLCLGPERLRPRVCGAKRLGREGGRARPDVPWKESGWPCFWGAGGCSLSPRVPGPLVTSVPLMSVCLSQLYAWATNTPIISSQATGLVTADHEPSLCPVPCLPLSLSTVLQGHRCPPSGTGFCRRQGSCHK